MTRTGKPFTALRTTDAKCVVYWISPALKAGMATGDLI